MAYQEITNRDSPNFWAGGNTKQSIVIHWWGDPATNPTAEGVVNWLCNPKSQVSAHFVATGTGRRVWQLVNADDRAWHAMSGNGSTIGIESDPRCRDEDYDVLADLISDLWLYYGKLPLQPHKYWVNTSCPGNYDMARIEREAEAWYNKKKNPTPQPTPAPKPTWQPMDNPRELQAKETCDITDLDTNKKVGSIKKGANTPFLQKKVQNGATYLRSSWSVTNNKNWGVDLRSLVEIPTPPPPTLPPTPAPNHNAELEKRVSKLEATVNAIVAFLTETFKKFKL